MPTNSGVRVEQNSEFFSLNAYLNWCIFLFFLWTWVITLRINHSFQIMIIFPKKMVSSFNLMKTILNIIFAQIYHSVLIIPTTVHSLCKDTIISRHQLFAEDFQVSSLSPVIIPELKSILIVCTIIAPKLEVGKNSPVKYVVFVESTTRRVDSC